MNLSEFLLARIAEDKAVARAATPSPWVSDSQGWVDSNGAWIIVAPYHDLDISDEDEAHVTRWQPARVLAECDAKLRIVGSYQGARDALARQTDPLKRALGEAMLLAHEDAVKAAALPYGDHPDYREEWRP